jgi:psp operon transcriptional activator
VYRHQDPERPIDHISFNPFHSPWAPAAGEAAQVASSPVAANEIEDLAPPPAASASSGDFRSAVADYERQLLHDGLRRNRFNQRATAAALGLSYDQLRHALKRHKLLDAEASG